MIGFWVLWFFEVSIFQRIYISVSLSQNSKQSSQQLSKPYIEPRSKRNFCNSYPTSRFHHPQNPHSKLCDGEKKFIFFSPQNRPLGLDGEKMVKKWWKSGEKMVKKVRRQHNINSKNKICLQKLLLLNNGHRWFHV